MADPAKEWAWLVKKAIKELWTVFERQNHSGHSGYTTMTGLLLKYFQTYGLGDPAWIVSKSPAIITMGGPQKLNISPLNKEAKKLKINVTVDGGEK